MAVDPSLGQLWRSLAGGFGSGQDRRHAGATAADQP